MPRHCAVIDFYQAGTPPTRLLESFFFYHGDILVPPLSQADAAGRCVSHSEPVDTPCGDHDVVCRFDDACDGLGGCKDGALWAKAVACPLGEWNDQCLCGTGEEPALGTCHPAPHHCDAAGSCISVDLADGTACGNQTPTSACV